MPNYTQIYYHIVFSTKRREPTLTKPNLEKLYRYLWGILNNHNGHLYRIGGVEDHVHALFVHVTDVQLDGIGVIVEPLGGSPQPAGALDLLGNF